MGPHAGRPSVASRSFGLDRYVTAQASSSGTRRDVGEDARHGRAGRRRKSRSRD